jgi:hypothetical protein
MGVGLAQYGSRFHECNPWRGTLSSAAEAFNLRGQYTGGWEGSSKVKGWGRGRLAEGWAPAAALRWEE